MSQFIVEEAELSDGSEVSGGSQPASKKPRRERKKRRQQISSDEDDEDEIDDDEQIRMEMKGFVVEEDDVDEGGEDGGDDKSDHAGSDSDVSDDLMEDDLRLIDENFGRTKGGRVEISDDEDDDRERIKNRIFGPDVDDDREVENIQEESDQEEDDSRSESELSETFIAPDDEVEGVHKRKTKKKSTIKSQVLDDAHDIFGVSYEDFYNQDDEFNMEDEEEQEAEGFTTRQKGVKASSLMATLEPSELEKGFVSAEDRKIISEDRPERFQIRKIPVTEADDHELILETTWIFEYAFRAQTMSTQEDSCLAVHAVNKKRVDAEEITEERCRELNIKNETEASEKVREVLRFMRKDLFEVPFIAFYRKESISFSADPNNNSLLIPDLWKVYLFDEKWSHLQQRKAKISETFKRVQQYIQISALPEADKLRRITERDFNQIAGVQSMGELSDVASHFQLYYGNELANMQEWEQQSARDNLEIGSFAPKFKMAGRTDKYYFCIQAGLEGLAREFGLTAEEFAENFADYVKNDVRQVQEEPNIIAQKYLSDIFPTPEKALEGAIFIVAKQFAHEPTVRRKFRFQFRNRLRFSVYPTKKGRNEIDENHVLWNKHYIKDKSVESLEGEEYLQYLRAKNDDLLDITIYPETEVQKESGDTLHEFLKKDLHGCFTFHRDEYYYVVELWNKLRDEVLKVCANDILIPLFTREAHEELIREAKTSVLRKAAIKFRELIKCGAYKPTFRYNTHDEDDEDVGTRVLSICYSLNSSEASFATCLDQDGTVKDYLRLINFTKRSFSYRDESNLKAEDMKNLEKLIIKRLPHVICLNGDDWDALRLRNDVQMLIKTMFGASKISMLIPVEIVNNEIAKVYMHSQMALQEFPELPPLYRQAVSLGRFLLDPLIEVCHLFNSDDDILFMKFHPLQNEVPKSDLLVMLQMECINRVNEVGVDINRCLEFPHTTGVLQFVCGLGPRKAAHLIKMLKQNDNLLESRTRLVTYCRMGPKVFMNAAGFIKIDTTKVAEKTDTYVEVLDGSRVHPEYYEWARKMAVDALEIDDPADPTSALEEILVEPERLKDLDLDAFAEELNRQGCGNKSVTLYDIRAELNYRYKDMRSDHQPADGEQLFEMLVKDAGAFEKNRLVLGEVTRITYRQPSDSDFEKLAPKMNALTNTWECPFCKRDGFKDSYYVQLHTKGDIKDCPGIPLGARIRLEGGLSGFVHNKNISDNFDEYRDPSRPGMPQHFRVINVDFARMQVDLTCKGSDLRRQFREPDEYFDLERYKIEKRADESHRKLQMERQNMQKRVTSHPSFHNIGFREAERMIRKMDQGDVIIRPSVKSQNTLSLMWKVTNEGDILQYVQVEEKEKSKTFEIGKRLVIGKEEYEDLDEIIARYVQPMAAYARDIMQFKYYMEGVTAEEREVIETHLRQEKDRIPNRIPYVVTASKSSPGKFFLSFLIGGSNNPGKVKHEPMSVTPEGIKFRDASFSSTDELVCWFKSAMQNVLKLSH